MNKESYFISLFRDGAIGDDAALLAPLRRLCVSKDAFCEGVHFRREWMSLYRIGYKAMAVNLSDAVAMNADPRYALLSVALPRQMDRAQMRELAAGLTAAAAEYGVRIVGGDTVADSKLDISITILAEAPHRPLGRRGIRRGDLLAYTGYLGGSARTLRRLLRGGRPAERGRFFTPVLRRAFIRRAARHLRAGMDISDGLFDDTAKLSRINRLGFRPITAVGRAAGCSGEEYEMLIAFSPRKRRALIRIAAATRTPLHLFARAERGLFCNPCRPHHF